MVTGGSESVGGGTSVDLGGSIGCGCVDLAVAKNDNG